MRFKSILKKYLFLLARTRLAAYFIGFAFERYSSLMPLNRVFSNENVVAFEHPSRFWEKHYLIVPKKRIRTFLDIPFQEEIQAQRIIDVFSAAQLLVCEYMQENDGNFALLINGGAYQDVPQVHFHLAAGQTRDRRGGFVGNAFAPRRWQEVFDDPYVTIVKNALPQRDTDYLVLPKMPAVASFSEIDFEGARDIFARSLLATQEFIRDLRLPAFTLMFVQSDIRNSGTVMMRIVSGKKMEADGPKEQKQASY